jgi:hypothetical protein
MSNKNRPRARNEKGRFVGDDPATPGLNEAYKYTKWEMFKYDFFQVPPDRPFLLEILKFLKWVFTGK